MLSNYIDTFRVLSQRSVSSLRHDARGFLILCHSNISDGFIIYFCRLRKPDPVTSFCNINLKIIEPQVEGWMAVFPLFLDRFAICRARENPCFFFFFNET